MGLATSHDCWHGAYSAFHRWRLKLAEIAGIPLPFMEGWYGEVVTDGMAGHPVWAKYAYQDRPGSMFKDSMLDDLKFFPIRWGVLRPDALHILLNHSDSDGEIAWEDCGPLADRLAELLSSLDGDGGGHIGNYRDKTRAFIDGLRLAAQKRENVDFH